ncbi:hypothetical protein PTTG_26793 [Puccinia triticina 1-1 BBBD Race 1]|uniref:Uncharacterized protein n=1 Tax=Puccinia triticina (isolate 1-1 / race 1 (BBBD)) TaxID=630390 RepID=A0A180GRA2_PUCT1|nr:hypothetical protein PTTG_26793 [Puccinia triticina 1-1 BBBD Race 1]
MKYPWVVSIGINLLINLDNCPPTVLAALRPNELVSLPHGPQPFVTGHPAPLTPMGHPLNNQMPVLGQPALYSHLTPEGFITYTPVRVAQNYHTVPFAGMTYNGFVPHAIPGPLTTGANYYPAPLLPIFGSGYSPVPVSPAGMGLDIPQLQWSGWGQQAGPLYTADQRMLFPEAQLRHSSPNLPPFVQTAPRANPPGQSVGLAVNNSGDRRIYPQVKQDAGESSHQTRSSKESLTYSKLPKEDGSSSMQKKTAKADSERGETVPELAESPSHQNENLSGSSSIAKHTKWKSSSPTTSRKLGTSKGTEVVSEEIRSLTNHNMESDKEEYQNNKISGHGQTQDAKSSVVDKILTGKIELDKVPNIPTTDQDKRQGTTEKVQIASPEEPKTSNKFSTDIENPKGGPDSKDFQVAKDGDGKNHEFDRSGTTREIGEQDMQIIYE